MNKKKQTPQIRTKYAIYTDGGCIRNPGGAGGYGIVLVNTQTGETEEFSQGFISTTNNRMEVRAIIRALELARERIGETEPFLIYSDSLYAINVAQGTWQRNKNLDLWDLYDDTADGLIFAFQWVRGHNGDKHNERCDALATSAMKKKDRIKDDGYERKAAEETDWKLKPKTSAMGIELDVPEGMDIRPDTASPDSYAKKHKTRFSCAKAICRFYAVEKPNFASYLTLKVGGLDTWSKIGEDGLVEELGDKTAGVIRKNLKTPSMQISAMRWACRGLTVTDAIRKALVDKEVNDSCQSSPKRRKNFII